MNNPTLVAKPAKFIWIDCNKLLFLIQTNYSKSVGPLQAAQSRTKSVFKAYVEMM